MRTDQFVCWLPVVLPSCVTVLISCSSSLGGDVRSWAAVGLEAMPLTQKHGWIKLCLALGQDVYGMFPVWDSHEGISYSNEILWKKRFEMLLGTMCASYNFVWKGIPSWESQAGNISQSCSLMLAGLPARADASCASRAYAPNSRRTVIGQWNRNPRPQLEPQITSLGKCYITQSILETPAY